MNHKKSCKMKDWGGYQEVIVGKNTVKIKCSECGAITYFKKVSKKKATIDEPKGQVKE